MLALKQKFEYFIDSVMRYSEARKCPSCGSKNVKQIDRKHVVTRLFECKNCYLYFRHPVESTKSNFSFYQKEYAEDDDITTNLPSDSELEKLRSKNFETESNRSADRLLGLFSSILPSVKGAKIVDYGTSWGYLSFQFKRAGMDVQSFELSVPRANFGNKKLDLNIKTSANELKGGNDIFFSSHVIEHVPKVSDMIETGKNLLKDGGYLITICPNGSPEFRKKNKRYFHLAWGKVHPNLLNAKFFENAFKDYPYYIASSPFDLEAIKNWDQKSQVIGNLDEGEIVAIAKI